MTSPADVRRRTPDLSRVEMTELVLPGDANSLGNAFGGKVMQWIDIAAGVAARRHTGGVAVTASMDSVQFIRPILLGDVVVLRAVVTRSWRTSMEVEVQVYCDTDTGTQGPPAVTAFLTFVHVDGQGRPSPVPELCPVTEQERSLHAEAEVRRRHRMALREQQGGGRVAGPSGRDVENNSK